jgi:hypothetical protein
MSTKLRSILALLLFTGFISIAIAQSSAPAFHAPVLITSAGQSADVTLAGMLFKKLNISATTSAMAKPADLGDAKTLVIVAGFSSKGLGAAGVSREQELARVQDIIKAAKEKKINVLMMHIGGKARRGNQSDDFNKIAAEAAGYMLVVQQGDEDQFFTQIATKNKIPIALVPKIASASGQLSELFK